MASKPTEMFDHRKPRDVLLATNPGIADLHQFIWIGGTIYRWSDKEPKLAFTEGFTRDTGYDSLTKHVLEANKGGSNWLSCSLDREATKEYGKYCYEIVMTHPHTKAMDANKAVVTITKHQNPFAHQQEISVYKHIAPLELTAVWLPIANPVMKHDPIVTKVNYLLFEEKYERVSRASYLSAHK